MSRCMAETWLTLFGWQPGAFKLAARDRWIGWSVGQQFRRLHLIANNLRFVILTVVRREDSTPICVLTY